MEFTRTAATPDGDAPTRDRVARTILENGPSTAPHLARLLVGLIEQHVDDLLEDLTTALAAV